MINIKLKATTLLMMFVWTISASANDILSLVAGKISDIDNGESLPYAKVSIKDTNRVATANQDGSFTILNISVGSILVINKMGYESEEIKVYPDTKRLTISLSKVEKANIIEEVIVTAATQKKMQQSGLSQFSLSPEVTSSLPNFGEQDIFRSMQLLPGVSGSNESSSGLVVRGVLVIRI